MSPRLKDIAEKAGVDIGTVSHVLNRRPKADLLKAETRERILRIADELGYCRNELAASIANQRSNVLAFISAEMGSIEYTGRIQNGVLDEVAAQDYAVTVYHLSGDNEDEIIRKLIGWRTAGGIFHVARLDTVSRIMKVLDTQKIPYGTANLSNPSGIGVTTDDMHGIELAVEYLKNSGHKKIGFFTFQEKEKKGITEYLLRREEGFQKAVKKYFSDENPVIFKRSSALKGIELQNYMNEFLKRGTQAGFDGFICSSDLLALEVLQAAFAGGFKVPEDFSLIGYGDLGVSSLLRPALTTISQNFENIGAMTARLVIDAVRNKRFMAEACNLVLPVKLTERESTRKI